MAITFSTLLQKGPGKPDRTEMEWHSLASVTLQ
jgi:hypothetical protein